MPILDFFRRSRPRPAAAPPPPPPEPGMPLDCCTEDWRIRGRVTTAGRLLDSLNRREALEITGPTWAPLDGSAEFQAVPGLKSVDPYDVLIVFASQATMPIRSQDATAAHRRSKETYDVILEVPPFHVVGTIHLYPGLEPSTLLDHSTNLFVAVTGGVALLGDVRVGPAEPTTILVNRSYLTRVHQVEDARRHQANLAAGTAATASEAASVLATPETAAEPEPEPEPATPEPAADGETKPVTGGDAAAPAEPAPATPEPAAGAPGASAEGAG